MFHKLNDQIKKIRKFYKKNSLEKNYTPIYTIDEITQNENGHYIVLIRILNKRSVFQIHPEELLANDTLVDQFSPRDIRTLTYLGYLGINAPKYKILAKRLSTQNDKTVFALKKTGKKKMVIKTITQIFNEREIVSNLTPEDAKIIGYTFALECLQNEHKQKEILLQNKKSKIKNYMGFN